MLFARTMGVAIRSLAKHKLRASLTVLGVVMGIASVTTMVSVGESTRILIRNEFQKFGVNVVAVLPVSRPVAGAQEGKSLTLSAADSYAIARECPSIFASSPVITARVQVIYRNANCRPDDVYGVGPDFLAVRNWRLQYGGFFTEHDIRSSAKVCVIGNTLIAKLFQTTNPIGETVRIDNTPFRVIGVLEKKGVDIDGNDDDDVLMVPYTTMRKRLQGSDFEDVSYILASAKTLPLMAAAEKEVQLLLMDRHRIHPGLAPDFKVQNSSDSLQQVRLISLVLTLVLTAIAAISLVVGGIGIMNVMLVSVTERTREIGVRMAVGARPRDIRRQFIIESILLACLGGVAGILLGVTSTLGITLAINGLTERMELPVVFSFSAMAISMGFAAAVGVFFGYYPARRASLLDPISALRYE